MGRKRHKAQAASSKLPPTPPPPETRTPQNWVEQVLALPRIARIGLAALFALAAALAATPVIDNIYVDNFFDLETLLVPALVLALLGLIVYGIGWVIIVGLAGEQPRVRRATPIYLIAGGILILLVLLLVLTGVYSNLSYLF